MPIFRNFFRCISEIVPTSDVETQKIPSLTNSRDFPLNLNNVRNGRAPSGILFAFYSAIKSGKHLAVGKLHLSPQICFTKILHNSTVMNRQARNIPFGKTDQDITHYFRINSLQMKSCPGTEILPDYRVSHLRTNWKFVNAVACFLQGLFSLFPNPGKKNGRGERI